VYKFVFVLITSFLIGIGG